MSQKPKSSINAEVIGLGAVVLSLILVAMELRQNTIALEGQAVLDLNALTIDLADTAMQYPELRDIEIKFRTDPNYKDYTIDQFMMFANHVLKIASTFEATWVFHEKGLIDDEQLETYMVVFCVSTNSKAHKRILDDNKGMLRKQYLEDFFSYCQNRPEGINW